MADRRSWLLRPISPHTNGMKTLPIDEINNEAIALFTFRYLNNMLPVTFDNFFKINMELHSHNTRS